MNKVTKILLTIFMIFHFYESMAQVKKETVWDKSVKFLHILPDSCTFEIRELQEGGKILIFQWIPITEKFTRSKLRSFAEDISSVFISFVVGDSFKVYKKMLITYPDEDSLYTGIVSFNRKKLKQYRLSVQDKIDFFLRTSNHKTRIRYAKDTVIMSTALYENWEQNLGNVTETLGLYADFLYHYAFQKDKAFHYLLFDLIDERKNISFPVTFLLDKDKIKEPFIGNTKSGYIKLKMHK